MFEGTYFAVAVFYSSWVVRLYLTATEFCINIISTFPQTATFCKDIKSAWFEVISGSSNINTQQETEQIVPVTCSVTHTAIHSKHRRH